MVHCCAYGCSNRTNRNKKKPGVGFHCFPKDAILRRKWIRAVRRAHWAPNDRTKICTEHFSESDVNRTYVSGPRLRENAVPTVFPAHPPHLQKNVKTQEPPQPRVSSPGVESPATPPVDAVASPCSSPLEQNDDSSHELEPTVEPLTNDYSVQVDDIPTKRRLDDLENQNKHLSWKVEQLNLKLAEKSRVIKNMRKVNTRLSKRMTDMET